MEIPLKSLKELIKNAYLLCNKNNIQDALKITQQCLQQYPKNPEIYLLLAHIQSHQKQFLLAEQSYNTAIALDPKQSQPYCFLGQLLAQQNRLSEAINSYKACLKTDDNHFAANFNLGMLYKRTGKNYAAMKLLEKAQSLEPKKSFVYYHLGVLYHLVKQWEKAKKCYIKATELTPEDVAAWSNLGAVYSQEHQYQRAMECYQKALEIDPNYTYALTNLAASYLRISNKKTAEKYLRQALNITPEDPELWRLLSQCVTYTSLNDHDYLRMRTLISSPNVSDEGKMHLGFALGKVYDDCKFYKKAFTAYESANQWMTTKYNFSPEAYTHYINKVTMWLKDKELPTFDLPAVDCQPIFIVGTPRSGKTLFENLLVQHPSIQAGGEVGIAEQTAKLAVEQQPKGIYPHWIPTLTPEQVLLLRDNYYHALTRNLKKTDATTTQYIIDTIPSNYLYIGFLCALFPKAKFIHCERIAFDACLFMYFKYFNEGHAYTYDLPKLASFYQAFNYMLQFWCKKLPNKILSLRYEDLIFETKSTIDKLNEFLELSEPFSFQTEMFYPNEIGHWKNYEKQLQPLIETLNKPVALIERESEQNPLNDFLDSARYHFAQDDLLVAESMCHAMLDLEPNEPRAWRLLGLIYYRQQNFELAQSYLQKAYLYFPNSMELHYDLANVYLELNRPMQADFHLKMAENSAKKIENSKHPILTETQRQNLLKAFNLTYPVVDEHETKLLLKGDTNDLATSDITQSWDQYFYDISRGSYRNALSAGKIIWRMRAWHFIFKHFHLIDTIYNSSAKRVSILDVGCASGYLRRVLEGNYSRQDKKELYYWGCDIQRDVLNSAIKDTNDLESGANGNFIPSAYIQHDITKGLPFNDSFFDYLVSFEMIKYLPIEQGTQLLAEFYRVLKSNGHLFISTTYSANYAGFMESVPYDHLIKILKQNGFEVLGVYGSQAHFNQLKHQIKNEHKALVNDLLSYYPTEMVAAIIAPLYPQFSEQIVLHCTVAH